MIWLSVFTSVEVHNGTLQNGNVTKRYVLQNGTCYTTVRVTQQQVLQSGSVTKQYVWQNHACYKTVHCTKRYMLLSGTFFTMSNECTKPWISRTFAWPNLILSASNPWISGTLYIVHYKRTPPTHGLLCICLNGTYLTQDMVSQTQRNSTDHGLIRRLSRPNLTLNMVGWVLLCLSDHTQSWVRLEQMYS